MKGFIGFIIGLLLVFLVFLPILHMGGKISLKEYYEGITNWVPEKTPEDYTYRSIEKVQEDLMVAPKAERLLQLERKVQGGQQLSDAEMAEAENLRDEIALIRRVDQKWSDVGKKINGIKKIPSWPSSEPRAEEEKEFYFAQTGEETLTVWTGPGTYHKIWANSPWLTLSRQPDGSVKIYEMPAGWSSWRGGAPEGLLRIKSTTNNTVVRFEKIR